MLFYHISIREEIIKYLTYIFISFRFHTVKCKLTMEEMIMYEKKKLDLKTFGETVKESRENEGIAREVLAETLDLSTRHTQYIETRGQHPSLQKFYEIVTMFNISVDHFFFPDTTKSKTTTRRQLDAMLDDMNEETELSIIIATAKAIKKARKTEE